MKKLSFLLIVALLSISICSCSSNSKNTSFLQKEEPEQIETIEKPETLQVDESDPEFILIKKILADWASFLYFSEYLYGDTLWAISYIEKFLAEPTWDNLQMAQTAICTSESYINARTLEELLMADEDYDALFEKYPDLAGITMAIGAAEQDKNDIVQDITLLKTHIFNDIYFEQTFSILPEIVEIVKQSSEINLRYIGLETNYILEVINDTYWTERLSSFISENNPYLDLYRPEFSGDLDSIENEMLQEVTKMEEIITQMSINLGNSRVAADELAALYGSNDISLLREYAVKIDGIPVMLPLVGWEDLQGVSYNFFYDDEGTHNYIKERDTLSKKADGCLIEYGRVSREEILEYGTYLANLGFHCIITDDPGDGYVFFSSQEDYTLLFTWSDGTGQAYMAEGVIFFAPIDYILSVQ